MTDIRIEAVQGTAIISGGPQQTFTNTALGGATPKAAIFIVTSATVNGTAHTDGAISWGITDGTRNRVAMVFSETVPGARPDTYTYSSKAGDADANDWVITLVDGTGAVQGQAKFISFSANSVTIEWTNFKSEAVLINVVLFGGADLQAYVNDYPTISPGSSYTITGIPFAPDVFIFGGEDPFSTTPAAVSMLTEGISFGFSTRTGGAGNGISNAGAGWFDLDNVTTADPRIYIDAVCSPEAQGGGGSSISAYTSDGATLLEIFGSSDAPAQAYLALKLPGCRVWSGIETTPTATGVFSHTGPGFRPRFVMTVDTNAESNDINLSDDQATPFGLGVVAGIAAPTDLCASIQELDGANGTGAMITRSLTGAQAVLLMKSNGSGGLAVGIAATHNAWVSTGFQRNYSVVQTTGRNFAVLAIGQPTSLPPPRRSSQRALLVR